MIGKMLIMSMDSPLNTVETAEFVVVSCTVDDFVVVSCTVDVFVVVSCTVVGEVGEPVTVGDDDEFDDTACVLVTGLVVVDLVVELLDVAACDGDAGLGVLIVVVGLVVLIVGVAAADCTTKSITYENYYIC